MFLKLAGRDVLVVGAGRIGEPKIESLLRAEAKVRVVAPQATRKVASHARARRIVWEAREFVPADLEGTFLVIAATNSSEVNHEVFREAQRRNVLGNVVDDPEHCDFYYPAVVRRGQLQIAISTGGQSPSLAQRLRKELEQQFGPEYESFVEELGKKRRNILTSPLSPRRRKSLLHRLAGRDSFEANTRGRVAANNMRTS
jgi:precorrin-2 dehydrogenase / sirohydrochlorin ferrochelatase